VLIEYREKIMEMIIEARTYSEAYIKTEQEYPGCKIRSITAA
jgi:hypothetical protein